MKVVSHFVLPEDEKPVQVGSSLYVAGLDPKRIKSVVVEWNVFVRILHDMSQLLVAMFFQPLCWPIGAFHKTIKVEQRTGIVGHEPSTFLSTLQVFKCGTDYLAFPAKGVK